MTITSTIKGVFVGILAALFIWCIGMFVYGETYSFLQGVAQEYDNAAFTRTFMVVSFVIGFGVMQFVGNDE